MVVNSPLIRPYFLGVLGGIGGAPLDSHDLTFPSDTRGTSRALIDNRFAPSQVSQLGGICRHLWPVPVEMQV